MELSKKIIHAPAATELVAGMLAEAEKFAGFLRSPDDAPLSRGAQEAKRPAGRALSGQSRDRDVGPNQTVENEKNALRVLQLKKRSAVRILYGFDPEGRRGRQDIRIESSGHSSRQEIYVCDAAAGRRMSRQRPSWRRQQGRVGRNDQHRRVYNVLSNDGVLKQ
jgi:hypothetical protein